ncbi:DUF3419 family protein [candidate division WOR-3 bacterium]|nr:DUF3419 family protein [candidate division WOR-3 bacterium]
MERDIFYSQCWEDPQILFGALKIKRNDTIVSISSGGDNSLSFLQFPIRKIYCIDNNRFQNYVLELKIASIKNLDLSSTLKFLGIKYSRDRLNIFNAVSKDLSNEAMEYFMKRYNLIEKGIIHTGKFENYFKYFRTLLLPLFLNKYEINFYLSLKSPELQLEFYNRHWNSLIWRKLFLIFFGKMIMKKIGRHPLFFKYTNIEGIGNNYLMRAEYGITKIPIKSNYMVEYILKGNYSGNNSLPDYLRENNYCTIKKNCGKISIHTNDMLSFLKGLSDNSIDKFNLSDIFELFSDLEYEQCLREIIRVSKPNARVCYWKNLVFREVPKSLSNNIRLLNKLSENLHSIDRGFFYNGIEIMEIIK